MQQIKKQMRLEELNEDEFELTTILCMDYAQIF